MRRGARQSFDDCPYGPRASYEAIKARNACIKFLTTRAYDPGLAAFLRFFPEYATAAVRVAAYLWGIAKRNERARLVIKFRPAEPPGGPRLEMR